MKLKALLLSLMILLPLAAIAAPIQAEINGPIIWVNPNAIKKWAPCKVSSTFDVEVKLWNKEDLTGVGVYGFDFTLSWLNSTKDFVCGSQKKSFITLQSVVWTSPWDHYFVVVEEIIQSGHLDECGEMETNDFLDRYHLAITALDGSDPLTDAQVVLATLTFHIDCEPLYPDVYETPFNLEAELAGAEQDQYGKYPPLTIHEVDGGYFRLRSYQPDVHLEPEYFCESNVDVCHTVEVWFSNISKAYGFGFAITYDNLLLEADIQSIEFCDAFPPPYEFLYMVVLDNGDGTSTLIVEAYRPCEKPSITHGCGPMATFCLNSIWAPVDALGKPIKYTIPVCMNSTITLDWAFMLSKCSCDGITGATREYDWPVEFGAFSADTELLMVNFEDTTVIDYYWRPQIGDLNLDCAVDIQDLGALAVLYGYDLDGPINGYNRWGELDGYNTVVDIFDFVVIAKYFGKPHECVIDIDTVDYDAYGTPGQYCWLDP